MKRNLLAFICVWPTLLYAQFCNPNGNLIIYSNYDGGYLTINVDQNIPNVKIGVVSYEAVQVVITGSFASNVTEVIYAGYNSQNSNNCGGPPIPTTSISAATTPVQILNYPAATLADPNGNASIICAYDCDSIGTQGGCNTVMQVAHFFMQQWPGSSIRYHKTQYNCWTMGSTDFVSAGGNCCILPLAPPIASFALSTDSICPGDCVTLVNTSTNAPFNAVAWTLNGASPSSASGDTVTVCYPNAGTYSVTLNVSNAAGSDNEQVIAAVNVLNPPVLPIIQQSNNLLVFNASPLQEYQWLLNGSPINGQFNDTLSPLVNGMYSVLCISMNGCSDTSTVYNLSNLSLNDSFKPTTHFYPNPAGDWVRFELNGSVELIELIDQLGMKVSSMLNLSGQNIINFDTRILSSGLYIVRMYQRQSVTQQHLLILH